MTEAVEAKLKTSASEAKPSMQVVGGLRHLKKETAADDRLNALIKSWYEDRED